MTDTINKTISNRKTKKQIHTENARTLLRQQHSAVLSTISQSVEGFPFGSIIPFLMDEHGDIIIYASDIAQHSRNMKANGKVSICVFDAQKSDSQASARVTVLAHAHSDDVDAQTIAKYFQLFPQAKKYQATHDFRFYKLTTEKVRYIGGFGEIYWFSKEEWQAHKHIGSQETGIINHMHDDHLDALVSIFKHLEGSDINEQNIEMMSCYAEGFHMQVTHADEQKLMFVPFQHVVDDTYDVRKAMVDLTKNASAPA